MIFDELEKKKLVIKRHVFILFITIHNQKFQQKKPYTLFFLLRVNKPNFWREKLFLKGGKFFQERNYSFCHELKFSNTYFYETPYFFET